MSDVAAPAGLEGVSVADTTLSLVDGQKGHLVFRGHWARDLALQRCFEEVTYLLWYGHLPGPSELKGFRERLEHHRTLTPTIKTVLDALPKHVDFMSALRTAVSAIGDESYGWPPTEEQAISILAKVPTMLAYRYRRLSGQAPVEPRPGLSHAGNYLYMLYGKEPSAAHIRALDAYIILGVDHGMNASTFTSRVVVSTRSDLVSAVTAAIGALKGPLHGGAPSGVNDLLEAIGTQKNAEPYMRRELEKGERLMGFGHRVYKTDDPRAMALRTVAEQLSGDDPMFKLAVHVEKVAIRLLDEYKPGRKLYTNVEFYAAAVLRAIGLPKDLYTPTFALSRTAGWCAHVLEQAAHNRLIRPSSHYVGPMPD